MINDEFAQYNVLLYNHHSKTNFNKFLNPEENALDICHQHQHSARIQSQSAEKFILVRKILKSRSTRDSRGDIFILHTMQSISNLISNSLSYMLRGSYNSIHFVIRYTVATT